MQIFQQNRYHLGSDCLITIVASTPDQAYEIFGELWYRVEAFEDRFSRFKATSELTLFNQNAGKKIPVSEPFIALLKGVKDISNLTNGLCNPFVLPALQNAGYRGSWPEVTHVTTGTDFRNRDLATINQLQIGDTWAQIPANSALDFGGSGKGYILDQLAAYLDQQGMADYWLSFGGDIICRGNEPGKNSWSIGIAAADEPERQVGSFSNDDGKVMAVATSGTAKRRGTNWHHIIDPRTGRPAETDLITASVRTRSALKADVFAKCLVILGTDLGLAFATEQHVEAAILQPIAPEQPVITWGNV